MKNLVRAFVVALTLTGSVAYTQIGNSTGVKVSAKTAWSPTPCCAPGDPDACGFK